MKRQPPKSAENGIRNGTTTPSNGVMSNGVAKQQPTTGPTGFAGFLHYTFVPVFLMVTVPNLSIIIWYSATECDGSFLVCFQRLSQRGFVSGLWGIWADFNIVNPTVCGIILGYCAFAVALHVLLPGPRAEGPVTPKGNIPVYKDNGFFCYVVTMAAFAALTCFLKQNGMSPTVVYDHFGEILACLTVFSHVICVMLYIKGLKFPSTSDCGSSGNVVFDYYWGTELYPRVFGVDVKVFTNCRFGMTVWPLLVLIFAIKSYELHGFVDSIWVSTLLQMIYFTKFFWWESGYMRTIDIMLDRAGFMICWGCLVFIPGLYASVSLYLVNQPVRLGLPLSLFIALAGIVSIAVNYIADKQKQDVRASDGQCQIWGRKAEVIRAKYHLERGETRESLLLVSGYWGLARHFHYVPELMLAFFWSVPGLFQNLMVYTYVIFLTILLVHRTFRDDRKCGQKYGEYWQEYCRRVPYKMVPGLF